MKKEEIIEYVQENACWLFGSDEEPYAVTYLGEPYWDESPRGLVLQIQAALEDHDERDYEINGGSK
jgi:hypothetical protein